MKTPKSVITKMKIADIKIEFRIRVNLDQSRVDWFAEHIHEGGKMPPVKVTKRSDILVDGRHRMAGAIKAGLTEIDVERVKDAPLPELIMMAWACNEGFPLPAAPEDRKKTVELLLMQGVSQAAVNATLTKRFGWPESIVRKLVNQTWANLQKKKLYDARRTLVAGGVTMAQAAGQHGVTEEALQILVAGTRDRQNEVHAIRGRLRTTLNSCARSVGRQLMAQLRNLVEGDIELSEFESMLAVYRHSLGDMNRALDEWTVRSQATLTTPAVIR